MTHHMQNNALDQIGEPLAEHGFDGMTQGRLTVLLQRGHELERAQALVPARSRLVRRPAGPRPRVQAQDRPDPHVPWPCP